MDKYCIYINLPLYLAEWITANLGTPVMFPVGSPQNAIIRTFLKRQPEGVAPECGGAGLTAVAIPDSAAKPAEKYHYLTPKGKAAVAEACKDLFLRALWCDISPLSEAPVGLNALIAAWCEGNGIGLDRVEAVRQCYYRIRSSYARQGINLRMATRKK